MILKFVAYNFGISSLYFFVGFLIGQIAESRGQLYALVPPLIIRTFQGPPFFNAPLGASKAINLLMLFALVPAAVCFGFLGGLAGVYLRNRHKMPVSSGG